MLSKNKGRIIATVEKNRNWKNIRLIEPDQFGEYEDSSDSEDSINEDLVRDLLGDMNLKNKDDYIIAKVTEKMKKLQKSKNNNDTKDIRLKKGIINPQPNAKDQREITYVAGPSGCGKSTWCAKYMEKFHKLYPDREMYIISKVIGDPAFNGLPVKYIKLDMNMIEDPLIVEDFENSLLLLDDIDTISDKRLLNSLLTLRDDILETGRHNNVTCLATSHQIMNYQKTRNLLNEAHNIVVFPGCGNKGIMGALSSYCGFNKKDINKVINMKSRWVMVHRNYPQYVMAVRDCYMVNGD